MKTLELNETLGTHLVKTPHFIGGETEALNWNVTCPLVTWQDVDKSQT